MRKVNPREIKEPARQEVCPSLCISVFTHQALSRHRERKARAREEASCVKTQRHMHRAYCESLGAVVMQEKSGGTR